ncbi:MAG: hypothetical protein ACJ8AD_15195 [Gemmatimonadaceae bacterium]
MSAARRCAELGTLLSVLASVAAAQQPTPVPTSAPLSSARSDSIPVFERPNGALLRPATLVYSLSSRRDTLTTPLGTRTVSMVETVVDGTPTWLVAESRTGTAVETRDSLYLTRADLAPERWVAAIGRSQLAASFTRDTMFAAMQTYQGRSQVTTGVPAGVLLTPAMVDRVVELLPLQTGFRTGASLLLLEMGAPRTMPAELTVEREESCALPDRPGDCWVVLLRSGAIEERLWVTKLASRVVKTEQATGAGLLTGVLTSETFPPPPAVPLAVAPVDSTSIPTALYPARCPPPCAP